MDEQAPVKYECPIKVKENKDGSFTLEWDEKDPRVSFLNSMSIDEITKWFADSVEEYLHRSC
jgi:hypothetical protein